LIFDHLIFLQAHFFLIFLRQEIVRSSIIGVGNTMYLVHARGEEWPPLGLDAESARLDAECGQAEVALSFAAAAYYEGRLAHGVAATAAAAAPAAAPAAAALPAPPPLKAPPPIITLPQPSPSAPPFSGGVGSETAIQAEAGAAAAVAEAVFGPTPTPTHAAVSVAPPM